MPLSPPQRRHALHTPGNPSLTNADQTVTKVDARLTKVDKTDHRQPLPHPQTPAKHGAIATAPAIQSTPLSTLVVNPSGASRTNLNKSEQIRTNPNTAERPDQIGAPPRSPPNTPKKTNPEHRRRPPAASHLPLHLRARHRYPAEPGARPLPQFTLPSPIHSSSSNSTPPPPIHPSPLPGGRLGGG